MQYVEFLGPPGSGKSTLRKCLSEKSNCCTVEDAVVSLVRSGRSSKMVSTLFRFLPKTLIVRRTDDLLHLSGLRLQLLDEFLKRYPGVQEFVLKWETGNCLNDKELALERFFATALKYQAIGKENTEEYCLADEGFLQKTVSLFLAPGEVIEADKKLLEAYLLAVPLPHRIIYVFADTISCYNRMMSRPKGLPIRMKNLSKEEIFAFIEATRTHFDKVISITGSNMSDVITIDSSQTFNQTSTVLLNHFKK